MEDIKKITKLLNETIIIGGANLPNRELIMLAIPVIKELAKQFVSIPSRPNKYLDFIDEIVRNDKYIR